MFSMKVFERDDDVDWGDGGDEPAVERELRFEREYDVGRGGQFWV